MTAKRERSKTRERKSMCERVEANAIRASEAANDEATARKRESLSERESSSARMISNDESAEASGASALTRDAGSPRSFSRHVALTLGARVWMAVNSVLAGIIIARWLGTQSFGIFSVLAVTLQTAVQIGSAGLPGATIFFVGRDRRHLAPAAINALLFAVLGGGACALLVFGAAALFPSLLAGVPQRMVAIAVIAVPFQIFTLIALNIVLVLGYVVRFNQLDLFAQSTGLISAVLALIVLRGQLDTLVSFNAAMSVVASAVAACALYFCIQRARATEKLWRADAKLFAAMMRYSSKYQILWAATFIIYRVDLLIVNKLRGGAEAGVYAVASQCGMLLLLLPNVISHLLFSRVAAARDADGAFTCRVARHAACVMLLACAGALPASLILPALYGRAFADVPAQFALLLPGVYLIGLQSVLQQYFNGTGIPRAIPALWVATLGANIALNFIFVPISGARGAAFVSTLTYALVFVCVCALFRARTGNGLAKTFILRRDEWRALLAAGLTNERGAPFA
jgi:O-antigen/teichoic acid export membrane protein